MVNHPPKKISLTGNRPQLAWPQGIIRDKHGTFRGFSMPVVGDIRLDQVLQPQLRQKYGIPEAMHFRLSIAYKLASLVNTLHKNGHYVIDMKPENIRVYLPTSAYRKTEVAILDTDGFAIATPKGNIHYPDFATEEYLFPKITKLDKQLKQYPIEQDRWALAIIIFKLLNDNIHPLSGIDDPQFRQVYPGKILDRAHFSPSLYSYGKQPHKNITPVIGSIHKWFSPKIRELFDRAFTDLLDPPQPEEWKTELYDLALLKYQCTNNKIHWLYGNICGPCALQGITTTASRTKQHCRNTLSSKNYYKPITLGLLLRFWLFVILIAATFINVLISIS